jgi:uroporphyrinogen-III synthase
MHILITRPVEDADAVRRPLEAMGHRVSVAPVMAIELLPVPSTLIEGARALIATSRNGLRALGQSSSALALAKSLPLYSVGPATTVLARELGFVSVIEGPGTAEQLVPLIVRDLNPTHGSLLHLAGKQLAFDMAAALVDHGFRVNAPGIYRSIPAMKLPAAVIRDLKAGAIHAVMVMSPKSAETFARLAAPILQTPGTRAPVYFCLSEAVANRLQNVPSSDKLIAKKPNLAEILALADPARRIVKT